MLASLKAAGVGITWTAATRVFHLDVWWNPQVTRQADDRVYRIGQTNPVWIVRMFAAGTIEEAVLLLSQSKDKLFDLMVEQGSGLSSQDIKLADLLALIALKGRGLLA